MKPEEAIKTIKIALAEVEWEYPMDDEWIMKFLVDELPYYNGHCYFQDSCRKSSSKDCPKVWDKFKVYSSKNPHECELLKEFVEDNS